MKKTSLIASLLIAAAFAATPAVAKTSNTKGEKICEAAAKNQDPAPKAARGDIDKIRSSDQKLVVRVKVKNADDSSTSLVCTVDRDTGEPTLTPAS